jgi:serine protease Do
VALVLLAAAATQGADNPDPTKGKARLELPGVLGKKAPENVGDLEALQEHVKKVLEKVTPATVGIRLGNAAGSGVIIDAEGHVLTAGHVSGKPGRKCTVILPDGKTLEAKTLGQNVGIDSGLIKITAKGTFPHVEMGDSSKVSPSQWVLSVGHPGGFKKGRTPVVRLGRVALVNNRIIRTDCTLVGGDSGGPLFDMHGRVIGIHSRIGFSITENVHVPVNTYKDTWARLAKGDSWGGRLFGFERRGADTPYLGVRFTRGGEDLKVAEVYKDTPAARAGLEIGDVVLSIDATKLTNRLDLLDFLQKKKVGDQVTLVVQRDDEEIKVKLTLGTRPTD